MEVYMIRHTSVDVPKGTCYGWTDVPVAATFEQEAAVTKKNLEEMLRGKTLDKVFSSTLSRASKLAAYCGYQHPKLDSRLKRVALFAHGGVLLCGGIYAGRFTADDVISHQVEYGGIQMITL